MHTIWTSQPETKLFPKLMNSITADTLVIGGGMAGVLCAHELTAAGADCVLLEAGRVGQGVTSGTTAVISAQHSVLYSDLVRRFGRETAKAYLDANLRGVKRLSETAWGIDCDFEMRRPFATPAGTARSSAGRPRRCGSWASTPGSQRTSPWESRPPERWCSRTWPNSTR